MMPYNVGVEKGTILIDATLTESDNRGRENFTVMHEVFHQRMHKKCFRDEDTDSDDIEDDEGIEESED